MRTGALRPQTQGRADGQALRAVDLNCFLERSLDEFSLVSLLIAILLSQRRWICSFLEVGVLEVFDGAWVVQLAT